MNTVLVHETADDAVWGELTLRATRAIAEDARRRGRSRRWGFFATPDDVADGFDGGLGLLALIDEGCDLDVVARTGEMLLDRTRGGGICAVFRSAPRLGFDALAVSSLASLGETPFVRRAVFELFEGRGVALFDCSAGAFVDRLALQRDLLLGAMAGEA